ncbi:twin-arginine translocation pathway signal [Tardiphaga alba]|uniref:Twin-arginine translocation pathway signal n=1 Tax=Tardiphaga alba TaxID=340268 RepID=A0ABX8AE50_9BRAD|nr:twin-arginine translocation pathway signal [Tardiphaga alba]QUS40660.1 twin-arginine translocation pathway signal [Tardiphaga alba]
MIADISRSRLPSRIAAAAALLLAVHLGGCAGMGDGPLSGAFVDPSIYDLSDCSQLEAERNRLARRTAELQGLIDKAQTGTAGSVVGEVAYRNDYISARAQAKLAEEQWQKNRCIASAPPPAPPSAMPANRSSRR